jgi:hypothetical protein
MTNGSRQQWLGLLLLGAALALGLVISAAIGAGALTRIKLSHQTIEVKGYAEKLVTSDWAVWTASFSVRAPALADGYRTLSDQRERVLAFLVSLGLAAKDVAMASVDVVTEHPRDKDGNETDEVTGYQLSQYLSVSTGDVLLVDRLSRESSALLAEGIEFESHAPAYYCTTLDDLKLSMLGQATKNARKRAETLASGSGGRVGELASASQGVFQITPVHSTDVSGSGVYDTSTIEKAVKAVVTVEYSLR